MMNQSLQSRFGGLPYDQSWWLGELLGVGHTLEELAIGRMEGSHILEATLAVVGMRPAVKSSLGTMTPNRRPRPRQPGPRPPAIRRDRLPLVSSS